MSSYTPPSADGHLIEWSTWDGGHSEAVTLAWENEAWTVSGIVGRERIQYVLRLSPTWQVRQFLLFRDLDEADLWLATDGGGRWGEMNGEHRVELDGCYDVELACTPFTHALPIRRLPLLVGHTADIVVARIDVDTLGIVPAHRRYTRSGTHRWVVTDLDDPTAEPIEFDVDDYGFATDLPERFIRR